MQPSWAKETFQKSYWLQTYKYQEIKIIYLYIFIFTSWFLDIYIRISQLKFHIDSFNPCPLTSIQASLGNISKCYCSLSQFSLLFSSLNADPGNLQDSSVGAAGQAAIERPQGIMGVTLVCSTGLSRLSPAHCLTAMCTFWSALVSAYP